MNASATASTPRRRPRDRVVDSLLFLLAALVGLLAAADQLKGGSQARAGLAVPGRPGRRRARLRRAVVAAPLAGRARPGPGRPVDVLGAGGRGDGGGAVHGRGVPASPDQPGRVRAERAGRVRLRPGPPRARGAQATPVGEAPSGRAAAPTPVAGAPSGRGSPTTPVAGAPDWEGSRPGGRGRGVVHSPAPAVAAGGDPGPGQGLAGLAERVALADGRLEHGPTARGGWRLAAWLPWPA